MDNKYKATFIDISNWQTMPYWQTGGTRSKLWAVDPNGNLFFFKESQKNYASEFWMEIIASKVGQSLDLNMLDYNIAYCQNKIGCISINMIEDGQILSEIMKFMTGHDSTYNPALKEEEAKRYNIGFLDATLKHYNLENHIEDIIKVIIFDCLIGNQDRHQENLGFIVPSYASIDNVVSPFVLKLGNSRKLIKFLIRLKNSIPKCKKEEAIDYVHNWSRAKFSPIYDSGSCLGRELSEENIQKKLRDQVQMNAFINRYMHEIRWEDKKVKYDELLRNLLESSRYGHTTKLHLKNIIEKFDNHIVSELVMHIDNELPDFCETYKLTLTRKEFVIKLLTLRCELLRKML